MKRVKVKICGIRTIKAARVVIESGADFLGFNFVKSSKRYIQPEKAREIIEESRITNHELRTEIVGVFQNQPIDEVNSIAEMLNLDFVQLHGNEDVEYIIQMNKPVIKRIDTSSKYKDGDILHTTRYILLDRAVQGQGVLVDLDRAAEMARTYPIFLAGGLTPENVTERVQRVRPFAVDVAGGVETEGVQDFEKIRRFIREANITI